MTPSNALYEACENKYSEWRNEAYIFLDEQALPFTHKKIEATSINALARSTIADQWATDRRRKKDFGWERLLRTLRKSHPRRYEVAIWHNKVLCGVAIGRVCDSKEWLSLTHIEGNPDCQHPLKGMVVPLAILGAQLYANLVGTEGAAPLLRIMNPVAGAMSTYSDAGFTQHHVVNKKYHYLTAG